MALEVYKVSNSALSLRKTARQHGITYKILRDQVVKRGSIKGHASKDMQHLSSLEEDVLVS